MSRAFGQRRGALCDAVVVSPNKGARDEERKRASSSSSFSSKVCFKAFETKKMRFGNEDKKKKTIPLLWSPSTLSAAIIIIIVIIISSSHQHTHDKKWTTSSSFPLSSNFLSGSNTLAAFAAAFSLFFSPPMSKISLARIHRHP